MSTINNNFLATQTASELNRHYARLSTSMERLSSGLRINSSADDAAGLAIRELMRADVAALNQGMRNANDAISMLQTADSALAVIDEKLIRMKELAEQAATGTYNNIQRLMIQSEFNAMGDEIDRIANATNFNGIKLLDGSLQGAHDGSRLNSTGKMKIHIGAGNDSAEDYYYVEIGAATVAGLFKNSGGVREVLGFDPVIEAEEIPGRGDNEGQSILALPNGNMLILSNVHTDRSIRFFEYDNQGNLLNEGNVTRHQGNDGVMQPMDARVLANGNVAVAFTSWGDDATAFVVYDSSWNLVSNVAIPVGGRNSGSDDLAMSVTEGSVLAGAPVNGNIVLAMTDSTGANALGTVNLGAGSGAVSTAIGGRHFVVTQNGGNLEGYFVDDGGAVTAVGQLCQGSGARIASLGDGAILVYSHTDPVTGNSSSYGRVVNSDGTVGNEIQLNDPDPANSNNVVDVQVMKDENGNDLDQVLVSWKNSANRGTLRAEAFAVQGGELVTMGNGDMTFVKDIPGFGLGPANIAVLANGSIAANWQKDISSGTDDNAFSIFNVQWGNGSGSSLDIGTQEKAQKMLVDIDEAIIAKDKIRAHIGALQNRLENTVTNISTQAINLQAAESRISDADIAQEMTEFVRNQVLTQSAVAMLGQANSFPHMLVSLLNG